MEVDTSRADTLKKLELAYAQFSPNWSNHVRESVAKDLYVLRAFPTSARGRELWAQINNDGKSCNHHNAVLVLSANAPNMSESREQWRAHVRDNARSNFLSAQTLAWNELAAQLGVNDQEAKRPREQKTPQVQQPVPEAKEEEANIVRPRANPAGGTFEAYASNTDLDWNGGAQRRTIYCGLGRKPPGSKYGNRAECLRKGFMVGRSKIHT